jgi:type II secretory pathway pseudopilin PulG
MKLDKSSSGFTIIEVMIALIVFMVAVLGLVSLQRASIAGTDRGRQHTAGVNIARYFLNELKVEISNWEEFAPDNVPANCAPVGAVANNLPLLARALEATCLGPWTLLDAGTTRVDEFLGHEDMDSQGNDSNSHYCVHYRVSPFPPASVANPGPAALVWQVQVRVAWAKPGQYADWQDCNPALFVTDGDRAKSTDIVELMGFATRELAQ